ncbi:MAG: Gfo/Idh/MocA family oxidoreductase [Clostridiales bacterium]|jgi:predicted dehydrogenase|nr:Gfo/Idh/MocA family oxidoreductase [Clostridiales bacterium]
MEKLKIAVIGCGTIANAAHIPAYAKRDDCELAWFCDIIGERAKTAAEAHGGKWTTDYKELLNRSDIDAVSVCTPNNVHAPISIGFLKAGKDVLCEKPAALNYAQALEMQKAKNETGRVLNIGVCNRFNTAVNIIEGLINSGSLGEIYHVYASFRSHRSIPGLGGAFTTKEIAGGGALIDWGVHFIDLVMYCCGDPEPKTVSGEAFCKLGKNIKGYAYKNMWAGPPLLDGVYDVEDSVSALVRTAGPVITIHGAWAQNIGVDEMLVDFMGDKGGIRLQYGAGFKIYSTTGEALATTEIDFNPDNQYEEEIDDFLRTSRAKGTVKSRADIDNAIITSKIIQAVYDSSDAKREIVF